MPTTAFSLTSGSVLAAHRISILKAFTVKAFNPLNVSAEYRFKATGTACTVRMYLQFTGPTFQASIDGGAYADVTMPSTGSWSDVTVFTGLSDAAHDVIFRKKDSSFHTGYYFFDYDNFVSVTGASPALAAPAIGGIFVPFASRQFLSRGIVEGYFNWAYNSSFGSATTNGLYPSINTSVTPGDVGARFRAKTSAVAVWGYCTGGEKYTLVVDGTPGTQVTTANTSRMDWTTVATGLDNTTTKEYVIALSTPTGTGTYYQVYGFSLTSPGIQSHAFEGQGKLVVDGDSIMIGVGVGDSTRSLPRKLAVLTNRTVVNHSTSGRSLTGNTSNGIGTWCFADEMGIGGRTDNDVFLFALGENDRSGGFVDATVFGAAYEAALRAILAGRYSKIVSVGILPSTSNSATRGAYNTAMQTAITNIGDASIVYWDTTGAFNPATQTSDGLHPTEAGYDTLITALQASSAAVPTYVAPSGGGGLLVNPGLAGGMRG